MEVLSTIVVLLVLGVVVAAVTSHFNGRSAFRQAIESLGLAWQPPGILRPPAGSGLRGRFNVEIAAIHQNKRTYTRFTVSGGGLPRQIQLHRQSGMSALGNLLLGEEVVLGDASFDAAVVIRGDAAQARAHLDADARGELRGVIASGAKLSEGALEIDLEGLIRDPVRLNRQLVALCAAAERLVLSPTGDESIADRLAHNALHDPQPAVRLACFDLLARHYGGQPKTLLVARAWSNGRDPAQRLAAAAALGGEGTELLCRLARDAAVPEDLRVRAVQALGQRDLRDAEVRRQLIELADRCDGRVLAEVLTWLAAAGTPPKLERTLLAAADPLAAVRRAGAACLGFFPGEPEAEAALLALLDPEGDTEVLIAASRALEHVGTVHAVAPLLELTKGLLRSGDLKNAARAAIEAIQARLGDVGAGRLALVDTAGEAGGLALAESGADGAAEAPAGADAEAARSRPRS